MTRGVRRAAAVAVPVGAVALVAGLGWAAGPRVGGSLFVSGAAVLLLGAALTAARLAGARDAPPPAPPFLRSGWAGLLIGAALLGLDAADGRVAAEVKFQSALSRGQAAAAAGDWAGAADAYSEAVRLDPKSGDALRCRGTAYLHLGRNDQALADLDAAVALVPPNASLVYNRGLARARLGDGEGALADFSEAVRLDPGLARAYKARAAVRVRQGDAAGAEADRRRAAELDPALKRGGGPDL